MLVIDGVSVVLGGDRVLESVSARVDSAGWLGLVGPNGAGKTTLIRAVAGLVPYEGCIAIAGLNPLELSRREIARLVAYVPQRPVLPASMTVVDYVLLGRSAYHSSLGAETRRDRSVVATVLDRLDLTRLADRPLGQISGGEAQRAVLGRALAQEAPVLVMDEPTSSLDLGHGQRILELTDELRREHSLTVLCALHDLTTAAQYADALLVLKQGRVALSGLASEILTVATIGAIFDASVEVIAGRDGPIVAPSRKQPAIGLHNARSKMPLRSRALGLRVAKEG